jgi:hypothetical protein
MRYSVFSGDRGGLRAFARPRRAEQYYVHAFPFLIHNAQA